jgi:competence protein ComEA
VANGVDGVGEPSGAPARPERLGIADRFDEALLRIEVWRERPGVAGALIVGSALLIAGAWWFTQPEERVPVEHTIPLASASGDEQAPAGASNGESAATGDGPASSAEMSNVGRPKTGADAPAPIASQGPTHPGEVVAAGTDGVESGAAGADDRAEPKIVVHVVGAVRAPGIVQLDPGSRVNDALRSAGGATDDADLEQLNLAAPLADGSQVRVPRQDQVMDGPLIIAPPPTTAAGAASRSGVSSETTSQPGPLNLNTATESELEELPGVGPATAAAITAWRDENGGFLSVDDLTQVPGIGPVKLSRVRDRVTV